MIENISSVFFRHWDLIQLYFPLVVIGVWRWGVWALKKTLARFYKPIPANGYKASVSVVIPVYNENPDTFQSALNSWGKNRPEEIIAVINHTDDACIDVFDQFKKDNESARLIVTTKQGKRPALAEGIHAAKGNLIALADSDAIWDENIMSILLAPFADPKVGGVGPRQDVCETGTFAQRLFNIRLDHRYYDEMTYLSVAGHALTCLSGRTAVYRGQILREVVEEMLDETFLGKHCISGEDKCLTRLIQERGWKVKYQGNARIQTVGAAGPATYFKQRIRWARNSWRSDLKTLFSGWVWKREKILALHLIDRFIQPFTLSLDLVYFMLSLILGHWHVAVILLVWLHLSRAIKIYPHLRHRPSDVFVLPLYVAAVYALGVLKIYAFVTMSQQGWITRLKKEHAAADDRGLIKFFRAAPSYAGTLGLILLPVIAVISYKNAVVGNANSDAISSYTSDEANINIGRQKGVIVNTSAGSGFECYEIETNDALSRTAGKHNAAGRPQTLACDGEQADKNTATPELKPRVLKKQKQK